MPKPTDNKVCTNKNEMYNEAIVGTNLLWKLEYVLWKLDE